MTTHFKHPCVLYNIAATGVRSPISEPVLKSRCIVETVPAVYDCSLQLYVCIVKNRMTGFRSPLSRRFLAIFVK